jgi:hypothetical protein
MLTGMTERDWLIALEVFDAVQSSRGEPGHNDRKFLEAIHYFAVHSITWRALPEEFGNWNSVWKRFWRLSRSGVFHLSPGEASDSTQFETSLDIGPDIRPRIAVTDKDMTATQIAPPRLRVASRR